MNKFRTMYTGSDEKMAGLRKYSEVDCPIFKTRNDPRVTKVSRFLRKFSIDELPQIINLMRVEISLVGPRPTLSEEVREYEDWHKKDLT
jgi:lipopolysaccharide/colanic/teichoic acid biosynthesis glycosyltransferase